MNTLLIILIVLLGIIAVLLLIALFTKKEYNIQREIVINVSVTKVFTYVKHLKNQDNYNKWVMVDPDKKAEFKGTDGIEGFIYAWNGNKKVGEGEQEIIKINDGRSVESEIRFVRPFTGIAKSIMETAAIAENQTKVKWDNISKMKYPMNVMLPFVEKMLSKDMDTSLATLKTILEK
ncbi:MAG TPA: SRPBCC family protein [Flavitalea sp.]|nr:SRPBCC family protein [Flavitalea sp.]HMG09470.1 SRPBCC family protein [Mucilaginibacter sp.]HTF29508.1 SRPBCC family protein [Flavitalea sp.]